MARVRRLLEEDLELDKCALDLHKAFISQQLEKVLEMAMFLSAVPFILSSYTAGNLFYWISCDPIFIFQVLESSDASDSISKTKEKTAKKGSHRKASKKINDGGGSDSSDSDKEDEKEEEELEEEEEEIKLRKKTAIKGKTQKGDRLKKRKTSSSKEVKASSRKRMKPDQAALDSDTDREDHGNASDKDESQSSTEKHTQVWGYFC